MNLKPLNKKIGKLVDTFLDDEKYYTKFKAIATEHNIISDDPDIIKMSMFSVYKDQLTFIDTKLEQLFTEWQLFKQLVDQEPYASLLKQFPERKPAIMDITNCLLTGSEVTDADIIELFKDLDDGG